MTPSRFTRGHSCSKGCSLTGKKNDGEKVTLLFKDNAKTKRRF